MVRDPADIPCGGHVNHYELTGATHIFELDDSQRLRLTHLYRLLLHIEQEEITRFQVRDEASINQDLRVQYMCGDISSVNFTRRIQERYKKSEKQRDIRVCYETLLQISHDLLRQFVVISSVQPCTETEKDNANTLLIELFAFIQYHNRVMRDISERFSCQNTQSSVDYIHVSLMPRDGYYAWLNNSMPRYLHLYGKKKTREDGPCVSFKA
jgi:hypothetical protein